MISTEAMGRRMRCASVSLVSYIDGKNKGANRARYIETKHGQSANVGSIRLHAHVIIVCQGLTADGQGLPDMMTDRNVEILSTVHFHEALRLLFNDKHYMT
jgi:hypothetical protein